MVLQNKKVLLRKCKRHTACHVAALPPDLPMGEDTPSSPDRGVPHPVLMEEYPYPVLMGGTPIQSGLGGVPPSGKVVYPHWKGWGIPRQEGWGTSQSGRMGYPLSGPVGGTPSPVSRWCGLTQKVKILPSPVLRMQVVKIQQRKVTQESIEPVSHLDLMLISELLRHVLLWRAKIFYMVMVYKWCRNKRQFKDIPSSTCLDSPESRASDLND